MLVCPNCGNTKDLQKMSNGTYRCPSCQHEWINWNSPLRY
jgi:predicted Zn-ribbon and HTH transcriptional regulator